MFNVHPFRNSLLNRFPSEDFETLCQSLEPLSISRQAWNSVRRDDRHVHFIEQGLVSLTSGNGEETRIDVAIVGPEGVAGLEKLFGVDDLCPYATIAHVDLTVWRAHTDKLAAIYEKSPAVRRLLLGFHQVMMVQIAESSIARARGNLAERMARWLLMISDRLADSKVPLTHEHFSHILGARRPGVTEALHDLAGNGLVQVGRGSITVLDRPGLERRAGAYYGTSESMLHKLLMRS